MRCNECKAKAAAINETKPNDTMIQPNETVIVVVPVVNETIITNSSSFYNSTNYILPDMC